MTQAEEQLGIEKTQHYNDIQWTPQHALHTILALVGSGWHTIKRDDFLKDGLQDPTPCNV